MKKMKTMAGIGAILLGTVMSVVGACIMGNNEPEPVMDVDATEVDDQEFQEVLEQADEAPANEEA